MGLWKSVAFIVMGVVLALAGGTVLIIMFLDAEPMAALGIAAAIVGALLPVLVPRLLDQSHSTSLTVVAGASRGLTFKVKSGQRLARSRKGEHLVPKDDLISNPHARLEWTRQGWQITDLGSLNGTFVNARKIDEPTVVTTADEIILGQSKFRIG